MSSISTAPLCADALAALADRAYQEAGGIRVVDEYEQPIPWERVPVMTREEAVRGQTGDRLREFLVLEISEIDLLQTEERYDLALLQEAMSRVETAIRDLGAVCEALFGEYCRRKQAPAP